jgi:hypothetical protein
MDLLITCTHDSELQVITAPPLISTLYKSLHAKSFPTCSVFASRSLATVYNSGDSSACVLASLLPGEYPTTKHSTPISVAPIVFLITLLYVENTVSKDYFMVACVFVAAGTCFPIRCLEIVVVYSPIS